MNKFLSAIAIATGFLASTNVFATTIQTCVSEYRGSMNAIHVKDGKVTGIAKLFSSSSEAPFTLVAKNGAEFERHGTITTTLDLTRFAEDGETCELGSRFTPLHSVDENSPWRQFQMRFDSIYDSTIMAKYDNNGIQSELLVANGWTWGTDLATIHVFELVDGEFLPVKYDIDSGNGELPAYKAGNRSMSTTGDGGLWQYRASAVSSDGRLIVGYARLDESVEFDKGSRISTADKFAMVWEITDSCSINRGKCNNRNASRLTSGSSKTGSIKVQSLSARQLGRNASENASKAGLKHFDMLTYDADTTMEDVYGIATIESGKYLVNGRSVSGKAMVVLVTL